MNPHTPGPWTSEYDDGQIFDIFVPDMTTNRVRDLVGHFEGYQNKETNCANVNLIASAPYLLAACEAVVNDCDAILDGDDMSGMSDQELFSAIRRTLTFAISKAKGGAK